MIEPFVALKSVLVRVVIVAAVPVRFVIELLLESKSVIVPATPVIFVIMPTTIVAIPLTLNRSVFKSDAFIVANVETPVTSMPGIAIGLLKTKLEPSP